MNETDDGNGTPADMKKLRIEGIAAIEVMRSAHYRDNHRFALEQAREYARLVKRVAEKTEAEVEEAMEAMPK